MLFVGRGTKNGGFTIVELLIVIVIIGILAALIIVAYNGIQQRSKDTAIQVDIKNFQNKMAQFNADYDRYPLPADLSSSLGIRLNKNLYLAGNNNNWYYCVTSDQSRYVVGVAVDSSRNGYIYDSETGKQVISGPSPGVWQVTTCPPVIYGSPPTYQSTGCSWSASTCNWAVWANS